MKKKKRQMLKGENRDRNTTDNLTKKAKEVLKKGTQNNSIKRLNRTKIKRNSTTFSNTMIAARTEGGKKILNELLPIWVGPIPK